MTGSQTLVARALLGAVAAAATVGLAALAKLQIIPARTFDRLLLAGMALSRVGLFIVIFLVFHIAPRGDLPAYYLPQALEVLRHHLPYRDFESSYAPLHPYLDALFAGLHPSALPIMFFAILAELCLLPLWLRLGRRFLSEKDLRLAALLYLASPVSLQFVVVDGQDNVVIALLLAAALLLVAQGRFWRAGVAFGAGVAAIKFLPLLYAPAFFFAVPRRGRWAAGTAAVVLVVYGGALLLHLPILQPLTVEGNIRSAGNLAYVLEAISGLVIPDRVCDLTLLAVLALVCWFTARSAHRAPIEVRLQVVTVSMAALTLVLVLLAKKCWPPYLMLSLFPVALQLAASGRRRLGRVALFAAFEWVAVTEHSVWGIFSNISSTALHTRLTAGELGPMLFLMLELLLLTGYGWLLTASIQKLRMRRA